MPEVRVIEAVGEVKGISETKLSKNEAITETLDKPITNDLLLSEINFKMFRRILSGEFSKEE